MDTPGYPALLAFVRAAVRRKGTRDARLLCVCQVLAQGVSYYNWVGFYLADSGKRELRLGPFVGEPTEHVLIPYGRGICGQAAERLETFVVQDVGAEANYLSCSVRVKAEIVLPVLKDGAFVAELDIDSHRRAPFTDADREFLEEVCRLAATVF